MEQAARFESTVWPRPFDMMVTIFLVWFVFDKVALSGSAFYPVLAALITLAFCLMSYARSRHIAVICDTTHIRISKGRKSQVIPLEQVHGIAQRNWTKDLALADAEGKPIARIPGNWPHVKALKEQLNEQLALSDKSRISTPFAYRWLNVNAVVFASGVLAASFVNTLTGQPFQLAILWEDMALGWSLAAIIFATLQYFHWCKVRYIELGDTELVVAFAHRRYYIPYASITSLERLPDPSAPAIKKLEDLRVYYDTKKSVLLRQLPVNMSTIEQRIAAKAGLKDAS